MSLSSLDINIMVLKEEQQTISIFIVSAYLQVLIIEMILSSITKLFEDILVMLIILSLLNIFGKTILSHIL